MLMSSDSELLSEEGRIYAFMDLFMSVEWVKAF